jgi:hypothetical protein
VVLEQYQVDHLFLLVGGNPLPNYVAAKTLLKDGGMPYFVYTFRTKKQAEALRNCLGAPAENMISLEKGREADVFHIRECVTAGIKQNVPKNATIGLNYTGGKKVMAVHAYEAIKEVRPDAVFSYLDSDGIKMVIEQGNDLSLQEKLFTSDVRQRVGMTFDTLWKLHDITLNPKKPFHVTPFMPEVASAIADIYIQDRRKEWVQWLKGVKGADLLETADQCPFEAVRTALLNNDPPLKSIQDIADTYFRDQEKPVDEALTWLRGSWLEDYTLQKLHSIASVAKVENESEAVAPRCSINTLKKNEKYFEVDVAFLRGYQLFVISCTTKIDSDNKEKLFEAQLRAQQLGGEEARFALVSCHPDSSKIKREMHGLLNEDIFEVFDVQQLANLDTELQHWLKQVDRETR